MVIGGLAGLTVMLLFGGAHSEAAARQACPPDMYERAESSLLGLRDGWLSLLQHQRSFGSCDDGALGEAYSDAVVIQFAKRWDQFPEFVSLSKRYPDFRRWVIRHIDATTSDDDLRKIMHNSARCADDAKTRTLCEAVHRAAAGALTEQTQMLRR